MVTFHQFLAVFEADISLQSAVDDADCSCSCQPIQSNCGTLASSHLNKLVNTSAISVHDLRSYLKKQEIPLVR